MKQESLSGVMKTDQWVKPFFKQYRKALLLTLVLGLGTFICAGALMFTSGYMISRAAEVPYTIFVIHLPIIFVRIFGIGKPILQYFERLTSHDWVLRMTSGLRLKLYKSLEKDAIFFRSTHRTGDILGLLAEDIGHIQNLYLRTIFPTIVAWLLYLIVVILLGFFSVWLALAMLLSLAVVVFLVPLVSVMVNGGRQTRRKAMKNELYSELTDNVLGVSDWIFAQRSDEYLTRYKESEQKLRSEDAALNRFARKRDLVNQLVFGLIAVLLTMWAASFFGGPHSESSNWIAAFALGFFPLIDAFTPLAPAATEMNSHRDSIRRLNDLPEADEDEQIDSPDLKGPLVVSADGVSFRYPESDRFVLKDFDLTVAPGEKLAILGRSGSGKSTLAGLIRGDLTPTHGSVTLAGVPTVQLGDHISDHIGVIQQQTYLFNKTVLENLQVGRESTTEEEAWDALEKVGLKHVIERLPEGLDTLVDEAGLRFSGGERHRIALARVLLKETPIVILDEPGVGLDPLTERKLLETIFENTRDKTLIMITHHLQGVAEMDRVIFIEDGSITIDGAPAELESTNAHYQRLVRFDLGGRA